MYITDDLQIPTKWQIPSTNSNSTTIEGNQRVLLWCDNQPEQGELHLGFKLGAGGEEIGLFSYDGAELIDSITFGAQAINKSFGRSIDGGLDWIEFNEPTPLENNQFSFANVREYYITCDPDSFEYVYDNYNQNIYLDTTISLSDKTWTGVRMRLRGDSSRSFPKKSLKFKFDDLPFINGIETLNFNAEYLDKSYMNSILNSLIMRESGQPCFIAKPAKLYLNGEFLGLYIEIENIDDDFLEKWELDSNSNLYKAVKDGSCLSVNDDIEYHWEKKTNEDSGREDLQQLIDELDSVSNEDYYEYAKQTFEYDKMVNIIAVNMLITNRSTYYHNYYMYHDNDDGKWTMFPWDMDRTLAYYGINISYQRSTRIGEYDNPFHERALLCEPIFRDIKDRIEELASTLFTTEYLNPVIEELKVGLLPAIEDDDTDGIENISEWLEATEANIDYFDTRYTSLSNQINNYPYSFKINEVTNSNNSTALHFDWEPSFDPNGDSIEYILKISNSKAFPDSSTLVYSGISETEFTMDNITSSEDYFWQVLATDGNNTITGFNKINKMIASSETPVTKLKISNYPNPFIQSTTINYELPKSGKVKIDIYNVVGQKVRTLVDEYQISGSYECYWDGKQKNGKKVASGVYLCSIWIKKSNSTKKILLLH